MLALQEIDGSADYECADWIVDSSAQSLLLLSSQR
jgi:hypothetical protein